MGKTISTHNGSSANRDHNIRNPKATDKQEHIDKSLKEQNEILHDERPRDAYKRIFGEALEKYNEKQRQQGRPERQIRDYYSHVDKDAKKHPVYEMIVQIGDRNDTGIDAPVERKCLKEFYEGWKDRNPNLECVGAYIHADESDGTLHMHVDYVPVAHNYKKGLETQNGLVKALKEQGFEGTAKVTAQIKWEARENKALEEICNRHGIEVIHPAGEKRQHLDTETYKAEKKLEEFNEKYETKVSEYEAKAERANKIIKQYNAITPEIKKMAEAKKEFERELPALRAQISEAKNELRAKEEELRAKKEELELTQLAIDEQMRQGKELGMNMEQARANIAEKRLFERFKILLRESLEFRRTIEKWIKPEKGRMLDRGTDRGNR